MRISAKYPNFATLPINFNATKQIVVVMQRWWKSEVFNWDIDNNNYYQLNVAATWLSSSYSPQPGWRSCSRSSPTSLPQSSPRSLAMALLRWERQEIDPLDLSWTSGWGGRGLGVWGGASSWRGSRQLFSWKGFHFPTRLPRSRMVRMWPALSLARWIGLKHS